MGVSPVDLGERKHYQKTEIPEILHPTTLGLGVPTVWVKLQILECDTSEFRGRANLLARKRSFCLGKRNIQVKENPYDLMMFSGASDGVAKVAGLVLAMALGVNADLCKDLCDLECSDLQECDVTITEGKCECKLDLGKVGAIIAGIIAVIFACMWCRKRNEKDIQAQQAQQGQQLQRVCQTL